MAKYYMAVFEDGVTNTGETEPPLQSVVRHEGERRTDIRYDLYHVNTEYVNGWKVYP